MNTYQHCDANVLEFIDSEPNNYWIQQLFSSAKNTKRPESLNSSPSILALPEISLQASVSSEFDLISDLGKQEASHGGDEEEEVRDNHDPVPVEDAVTQVLSGDKRATPLKRSRSAELHSISERRRRDRINKKLKVLRDLLPRCQKKDRASILEDAANYIKTLKPQVETMSRPGKRDLASQHMTDQGLMTTSMSPFMPVRPCLGMGIRMAVQAAGMCCCYSAPYAPFFQFPVCRHPFSDSALFSGLNCSPAAATEPKPKPQPCREPCIPSEASELSQKAE